MNHPFGVEPRGGDPDRMRGRGRRPIWLTLVLLVVFLALFWLVFGRGGDDESPIEPASGGQTAGAP